MPLKTKDLAFGAAQSLGSGTLPARPAGKGGGPSAPAGAPPPQHSCCITMLGHNPDRSCWGTYPLDASVRSSEVLEAWYEDNTDEDSHITRHTWFNTPWYRVPKVRHLWGDPQTAVHHGGQELFGATEAAQVDPRVRR